MEIFFSKSTCGFYRNDIHRSAIPDDAKLISEARYQELMAGMADNRPIVADDNGFPINLERYPDIGAQMAVKRRQIDAAYEQAMAVVRGLYPQSEIAGWPEQVRAVELLESDPKGSNPVLEGLAEASACSLSEMAGRIRSKRDAYLAGYGQLTGLRHSLIRELKSIDLEGQDAARRITEVDISCLDTIAEQWRQSEVVR